MRLEGYPGARIEKGPCSPLKPAAWVFQDKLDKSRAPLRLALRRAGKGFVLTGATEQQANLARRDGFLEIRYQGKLVGRPLKLSGLVGDTWRVDDKLYTVYGYDRIPVLGRRRRALVVAVEQGVERNFYWFVQQMGWVRIRTEREGRPLKDAALISYTAN